MTGLNEAYKETPCCFKNLSSSQVCTHTGGDKVKLYRPSQMCLQGRWKLPSDNLQRGEKGLFGVRSQVSKA